MKLTDDDRLILEWLTLVHSSTYATLSAATGRTVDALRHRLPALHRAGLLHRQLVRHGHKTTVVWFATASDAAAPKHRPSAVAHAAAHQADPTRAAVLAAALLPHFASRGPATVILHGPALAKEIDALTLEARMRETASMPAANVGLAPLPDALVVRPAGLTAIELRLGKDTCDWPQRLRSYAQLGVRTLEVHTNLRLLEPSLRRASHQLTRPHMHVSLHTV